MSVNRISLNITEAQKAQVATDSGKLAESTQDFNVVIPKEELDSMPKIADGRIPFVQKAAYYSTANPEHKPLVLDNDEFQTDVTAFVDLREMSRPLRQILEKLDTAMAVAGSEAFYAARDYYRQVQLNAKMGVPGAQAIYEDLRQLFEQSAKSDKPKS
jgi:hypothetical protein